MVMTLVVFFCSCDGKFYHKFASNILTLINLHILENVHQTCLCEILRMTYTNFGICYCFGPILPAGEYTQYSQSLYTLCFL